MTEYALLDLGCNGEDIYGLEFSPDGSRVTYLKGKDVNFLAGIGCRFGQGYLFSQALPPDDFEQMLLGTSRSVG